MLNWALAFFILATIAAMFGYGDIFPAAAAASRVLFFVFLIAFMASFIKGLVSERSRTPL